MHPGLTSLSALLEKALALGADAADAVLFETTEMNTSQRLGKPEGLERSENSAIGLRVFVGDSRAIVSSNDMLPEGWSELAERAVAMASVTPPDADATLAPRDRLCENAADLDLCDSFEPDARWLSDQCARAEEAARATEGITNSEGADAHYSRSLVTLAIAEGKSVYFAQHYPSSHFSVSVSVLAGSGTGMERDYDFTSAHHRGDLADAAEIGREAARLALRRLNPRKLATCQVPVVFDPRVSRSLLSSFAGAISGASVARGSSFLKDAMDTRLFAPGIDIIDDPHIKRGHASRPFDGEGVANQARALVENGVLSSWLLDMRSANLLGLPTTGHASRGIGSGPSPSATNLYMRPGALSPEALLAETGSGLYVTETFGMGINTVTGDYSQGASGFWFEKGEIAYPVSEITIAGRLKDMFAHLTPANDLVLRYATNAPTIRIEGMTVAGT